MRCPAFATAALLVGTAFTVSARQPTAKPSVAPSPTAESALRQASGAFFRGDGLYSTESLKIQGNRYVYKKSPGDVAVTGVPEYRGLVSFTETGILLTPPVGDRQAIAALRVVSWGPRRYLVENARLSEFCDQVEKGWEPRNGPFGWWFLRDPDWTLTVPPKVSPAVCRKGK
jgi:hypothetical protein